MKNKSSDIWNKIWSSGKYAKQPPRSTKAAFKLNSFQELHSLPKDLSLALDYGCGAGYFSAQLQRLTRARVIGYDHSSAAIQHALMYNKNDSISYVLRDLTESEIECAEKADLICMNGLIEHVENHTKILNNASYNLKNGGILYVTSSNLISIYYIEFLLKRFFRKWDLGLQKHYSPQQLKTLISRSGFTPILVTTKPCIRSNSLWAAIDRLTAWGPLSGRYIFLVAKKGDSL